jgi:hypothetical protein
MKNAETGSGKPGKRCTTPITNSRSFLGTVPFGMPEKNQNRKLFRNLSPYLPFSSTWQMKRISGQYPGTVPNREAKRKGKRQNARISHKGW